MEQAEQPGWELTVDGECLVDQEEVEWKGEVCNGLGAAENPDLRHTIFQMSC